MVGQVGVGPASKDGVTVVSRRIGVDGCGFKVGANEVGLDPGENLLVDPGELWADQGIAFYYAGANVVDAVFMHSDLDPRLVFIIAATQQVIDRYDSFECR